MAVLQESDWTTFNIQDVDVSLNGLSLRGLSNDDVCIKYKYDEERAKMHETIDNKVTIVYTNSKMATVSLTANNLTKTWQTLVAFSNAQMSGLLIVQCPKSILTLTGATVVDLGEGAYGKDVSKTEIVLRGSLTIAPIGTDVVEIPTL